MELMFKETREEYAKLVRKMACLNCRKAPKQTVYMLDGCLHKYCSRCVEEMMGNECRKEGCKVIATRENLRADPFCTDLLRDIWATDAILKTFKIPVKATISEAAKNDGGDERRGAGNHNQEKCSGIAGSIEEGVFGISGSGMDKEDSGKAGNRMEVDSGMTGSRMKADSGTAGGRIEEDSGNGTAGSRIEEDSGKAAVCHMENDHQNEDTGNPSVDAKNQKEADSGIEDGSEKKDTGSCSVNKHDTETSAGSDPKVQIGDKSEGDNDMDDEELIPDFKKQVDNVKTEVNSEDVYMYCVDSEPEVSSLDVCSEPVTSQVGDSTAKIQQKPYYPPKGNSRLSIRRFAKEEVKPKAPKTTRRVKLERELDDSESAPSETQSSTDGTDSRDLLHELFTQIDDVLAGWPSTPGVSTSSEGAPPVLTPNIEMPGSISTNAGNDRMPPPLTPYNTQSTTINTQPMRRPVGRPRKQANPASLNTKNTSMKEMASSSAFSQRFTPSSQVPTSRNSLEKRNSKGETALLVSCRIKNLAKVRELVEAGADVNTRDYAGWTPLHEAVNGRGTLDQSEIVRLLCEKGADVNALGLDDETPLFTAVRVGAVGLVQLLLELNASPNIRNVKGKLPKDVTLIEEIVQTLEDRMNPDLLDRGNSTILSTVGMVELKVMLSKAVVYFAYEATPEVVKTTTEKLGLKVADELSEKVTHVIHKLRSTDDQRSYRAPLTYEYLFAVSLNMWQLSSDWISASLEKGSCVSLTAYEIRGHDQQEGEDGVPQLARSNREKGNPKLLDGFTFNLYKTCGYESSHIKLDRKQLMQLIKLAGGNVTNREPVPDILAMEIGSSLERFHVIHNNCTGDAAEKLSITSHIILYGEKDVPPANKRYTLEYLKTLNSRWVIDSLLKFKLQDPEKYL